MNKSNHTPAPWTSHRLNDDTVRIFGKEPKYATKFSSGQIRIADVFESESDESNTRLIAAAPELLEALEKVSMVMGEIPITHLLRKEIRAAIAKARGVA